VPESLFGQWGPDHSSVRQRETSGAVEQASHPSRCVIPLLYLAPVHQPLETNGHAREALPHERAISLLRPSKFVIVVEHLAAGQKSLKSWIFRKITDKRSGFPVGGGVPTDENVPEVAGEPQNHLKSVDLPDPFAPRSPTISPRFTGKGRSSTASRVRKTSGESACSRK